MIKAYLKNGVITLKLAGGKEVSFVPGSAVTTIGDDKQNPYAQIPGVNLAALKKTAMQELNKLYDIDETVPEKVLCALDAGRKNGFYTNHTFSVSFESLEGTTVLAVSLKDANELLAFEIICALHSKKPLKKCENCDGYFFPTGRSDAIYCDRLDSDGYPCKKIGAHRQYRKNSRQDNIKALYDKTTKHNRYLKSRGAIAQRDYERWIEAVSKLYSGYKKGTVSEYVLTARLDEELTAPARSSRREMSDYLL